MANRSLFHVMENYGCTGLVELKHISISAYIFAVRIKLKKRKTDKLNTKFPVKCDSVLSASTVGPHVTCASPKRLAGHDLLDTTTICYPSPSTSSTSDPPQGPVNTLLLWGSSSTSKAMTQNQNHTINKGERKSFTSLLTLLTHIQK